MSDSERQLRAGPSDHDALRALLEASSLPAMWFDAAGRLGMRNAASVRALGGAAFLLPESGPGGADETGHDADRLFERDPLRVDVQGPELFRAVWPSATPGLRFRRVPWTSGVLYLAVSERDAGLPGASGTTGSATRRRAGGDEALEAMASLAGGVAHDLNNHLTAIFASLQQVRGALGEQQEENEAQRALIDVEAAAERARRLSQQLVAFSRCQIDCPRPLSFDAAVRSARPALERGLRATVSLELATGEASVLADPGPFERLLQVVGRWLRGASTYRLRTSLETEPFGLGGLGALASLGGLGGPEESARCRLHVRAGEGDVADQENAFAREELDELARRVGADVHLDDDGRGVRLSLPSYDEDVAEAEASADEAVRELLVVEDDRPVREVLCRILSKAGYVVHAAANAAEALALEPGIALDLLVTDVHMPGQNGFELYRRMCSRRGALRVLFVSGLIEDEAVRSHLERHRLAFLPKPFTASDLLERVTQALSRPAPRVRRLLVVDDEPQTLAAIEHLLEGTDYECRLVRTVEEALRVLEAGGADVVLSDMVMPDRDGLELLREIDRRRIDCRFVAMSGHMTRRAVLAAAEELGAACALHKPFGRDELLAALELAS